MIAADEDALICDFFSTYRVSCYRGLRPSLAATLASGFGPDSLIYQRRAGLKVPFSMYLQALEIDLLRVLIWQNTEDGAKNRNRPDSLAEKFRVGDEPEPHESFSDPDSFEAFRASLFAQGGE